MFSVACLVVSEAVLQPQKGQPATNVFNRRVINKLDFGCKTYTAFLNSEIRQSVLASASGQEWGGLPGRSTIHPMVLLDEIQTRARKQNVRLHILG